MENTDICKFYSKDEEQMDLFFITKYCIEPESKKEEENDLKSISTLKNLEEKNKREKELNRIVAECDNRSVSIKDYVLEEQGKQNFYLSKQPYKFQRKSFNNEYRRCNKGIIIMSNITKLGCQAKGDIYAFLVYDHDKENHLKNALCGNIRKGIHSIQTLFLIYFKVCNPNQPFRLKFIISYKTISDTKKNTQTEILYSDPFFILSSDKQIKKRIKPEKKTTDVEEMIEKFEKEIKKQKISL